MPTFDTPEPIAVTIVLGSGSAHVIASDRTDTTVQVRATDESKQSDVVAAEQTRVEYANGTLRIKAPNSRGPKSWLGKGNSIAVLIEVPVGSPVEGEGTSAEFVCQGSVGDCRFQNVSGEIRLGRTGAVHVETVSAEVSVTHAVGHVEVETSSGGVRIGKIDGTATVANSSGDIWVGEATGVLKLNSANGGISVDRAYADVEAKTARGRVRVGEVIRGTVEVATAGGQIDIGISEGTAAWLDAVSRTGRVLNSLKSRNSADQFSETARIRARTWFGDIVVRRSS